MATAVQKITLSSSRDIPLNKLILSQSNVRRVKAGVSIEDLAADIARRGCLLQSLNVRPVLGADGAETGMFEVPAGGRRFKALQLLVKQKRLAKTAPVPCVVRDPSTEILAEDDSLAENVQRAPLHPLDQFRAFQALREKGQSEEDIAAAFFVGVNVVKQRPRLAAVSEKLLDVYADDGMSLEQLMSFTVTTDHARQEQVWDSLQRSYSQEPYQIRRILTERTVRASDKRVLCLDTFQHAAAGNCLEAAVRQVFFSIQPADLKDSPSAKAVAERHEAWKADLPKDEAALWDWLAALDDASRGALLAHCVSFGVNALYEKGDRYGGPGGSVHGVQRRLVQADRLARAVGLDMVEAGWRPTVDSYLGRVTKPRILEAVREAKGEQSAELIDHLKKADMAKEAKRLLEGTGWLPEPLRSPETEGAGAADAAGGEEAVPAFLTDDEESAGEGETDEPTVIAAE